MSAYSNEGTPLLGLTLAVDSAAFDVELARDWGWILAAGVINLVAGIGALFSPTVATVIVLAFISVGLIIVGFVNLMGVCYVEQCYRVATFLSGAIQLTLGILMATHSVTSLVVLTSIVAALFMVEGIFRSVLALKNQDISGWGMSLASGICAILFSLIVWSAFPRSSAYTLGILVGVNWVLYGALRISLAMYGRATAKSLVEAAGGSNV
jgi:uncharacterized membrane protein HdeD (DUF308 family)